MPTTGHNTQAISINGVTKRFGSKTAVDQLTLEVPVGEIFAFLGPNGAGKTTTIKMVVGLLSADSGTLAVCGHTVKSDGLQARARMAYVPDQPYLYDKLTGREFLAFVRQMYRVPVELANTRIGAMTERLGMSGFLDRLCETYSHGMKQKIVLAGALLHDPDVLIVDEPMVGLDPRTARVVKDLFLERSESGKTVFMSTHTLSVAEAVAHRIGIIHNGRLIALGSVNEVRGMAEDAGNLEEVFLHLTADPDAELEGVPLDGRD